MAADQGSSGSSEASVDYQEIVVTDDGGVRTILLNRPHKYNAITLQVHTHVVYVEGLIHMHDGTSIIHVHVQCHLARVRHGNKPNHTLHQLFEVKHSAGLSMRELKCFPS